MSDLNDFINLDPKNLNIPVYSNDTAADNGFGSDRKIGSIYWSSGESSIKIFTGSNWSSWSPG